MKNSVIDATLFMNGSRVTIKGENGKQLIFRAGDSITFSAFSQKVIVYEDERKNVPGCDYAMRVILDSRYMMKSWWKDPAICDFFYPGKKPHDFISQREVIRRPKTVLRLKKHKSSTSHIPSASGFVTTIGARPEIPEERLGPAKKRGQMVWVHKTAPTIEIEGGSQLSPEELSAMRRRN